MDLQGFLKRFYFDMVTNELRLMSDSPQTSRITYNSLLYLDMISCKQNCTVSFLAERLKVAKSAVTHKVNELVKQGLVVRTQSQADKRVFYLSLSGAMVEENKVYNGCLMEAVADIENTYSEKDIAVFCGMLARISAFFTMGADSKYEYSTVQDTE